MTRNESRRDRAAVLLAVLGILGVLSTLAIAFARTAAVERTATGVRVEEVRAKLAATGGMERAIAEIRIASRRPYDGPDSVWFYRGTAGRAAGNGVPLRAADAPSLAAPGRAWGRVRSGDLPSTWEPAGDTYSLKIFDSASMIDLNAPVDPRLADADQPFVRMLASLSAAIDPVRPALSAAEAERVLAWRRTLPGGRFASRLDLLNAPGAVVTAAELDRLADFVTTHAWSDPLAVAPMDPLLVPAPGAPVHGRVGTGVVVRLPRRPIDLNTAPPEVLAAALAGVSAFHVDGGIDRAAGAAWTCRGRSARTAPVSLEQARDLAAAIVLSREGGPFRTWEEYEAFLAAQVAAGRIDELQAGALLANADPNVDTNRANPDAVVHREIDKFDLVASTTEFCFGSNGVFEIESIGRVTSQGGQVLAEANIRAAVEVFRLVRHSVQSQFQLGTFRPYTFLEPVLWQPLAAITTEEDLSVEGDPVVRGSTAHVHSNATLRVQGNSSIAGNATASGAFSRIGHPSIGGVAAGSRPQQSIPDLDPALYRGNADVVFAADGRVTDGAGRLLGQGSYSGFSLGAGGWRWSGGGQPGGILWFEGDLDVTSRTSGVWSATFVATGSIFVRGNPDFAPSARLRVSFLAGADVELSGTAGSRIAGAVYARDQVDLAGDVEVRGAVLARGRSGASNAVRTNRVGGSVVLQHDGGTPLALSWITTTLPAVVSYPEADARAGNVHLPSAADYDGWIGLATSTLSRSWLGAAPYADRILARWRTGSLDAEFAGGSPAVVGEGALPTIAPVAGNVVPGHLLPDGCLSEAGAVLSYSAAGNVGPVRGTIAFWFKPSWDAVRTTRTHHLVSLSRADAGGTQVFEFARTGQGAGAPAGRTGFAFERSTIENPVADRRVRSTWAPAAHRWVHVALVYDFDEADGSRAIRVYVDGVEMPGSVYEEAARYALGPSEQATSAIAAGNLIRLGERAASIAYELPPTAPEATYDELLCDDVRSDAARIAALHGEGRFYSGGVADYLSTALSEIPSGAEVLHSAWTLRTPATGPAPAPVLSIEDAGTSVASTADPAGLAIGRVPAGELRYRVTFLAGPTAAPLYEVPVVDDVTVAYSERPRILSWEE